MEDTITEKRNLANEDGTAQTHISNEIEQLRRNYPATTVFNYNFATKQRLSGPLDLHELGRLPIKHLLFTGLKQGEITEIERIPDGITNFQLNCNLLVEMPVFPKTIESIDLTGNYIETVDLAEYPRLKVLRIRDNRVREIANIPPSIEEMDLGNNRIQMLDLAGLNRLRKLNCENNDLLRILNVPPSLVDLKVDSRIAIDLAFVPSSAEETDKIADAEKTKDVANALDTYFALKDKYERRFQEQKKTEVVKEMAKLKRRRQLTPEERTKIISRIIPECINCKRRVRTVFKTVENRFIAHCGDTENPCPLMIQIYRGEYELMDRTYAYYESELEEIKDSIIRLKMDVLFGYEDESKIMDKFKTLLSEYNSYSFVKKTMGDQREDTLFNANKRELINLKIQKIDELKDTMDTFVQEYSTSEVGNPDVLNVAMDTYVREYLPEVQSLSQMKYGVNEMVSEHNPAISILKQSAASLRSQETTMGEVAQAVRIKITQDT